MRILYSFIVTMRTLIAVWYRERALESVSPYGREKRKGENASEGTFLKVVAKRRPKCNWELDQ